MLSRAAFYGKTLYRPAGFRADITVGQGRCHTIGGAPAATLHLPSRTGLPTGGPYFRIRNVSGASMVLNDEAASALVTIGNNTVTDVWLAPSRWRAFVSTLNAAVAINSVPGRSGAIGDVPVGITPPTIGSAPLPGCTRSTGGGGPDGTCPPSKTLCVTGITGTTDLWDGFFTMPWSDADQCYEVQPYGTSLNWSLFYSTPLSQWVVTITGFTTYGGPWDGNDDACPRNGAYPKDATWSTNLGGLDDAKVYIFD